MIKLKIKKHKKFYGFTLVELIIVITILAILATISFVSFSGYTSKSRDSNRLFSLKEISKTLEIQKEMTGNYPQPDDIYAKGGIPTLDNELFSVGLIGKNVSNYVKLGLIPLDPKTGNEYLYGLTRDNKNFQIAGTLENLQTSMIIPVTYADNGMQAVVEGNYKGVIKFSTGSSNYIGNVPSLIFSRSGTYTELRTFVINKGKNLPYSVDGESLGTGLGETEVLKELHNKDSLTLTGVIITNSKSEDEIKEIANILGISDVIIADNLGNKEYASSGGSSGGEGNSSCPTNPNPDNDFTFDAENKRIISYDGTSTEVKIPCKIGGVDVEVISSSSFQFKNLTKVEIPNSVNYIGHSAFNGNQLTTITIPKSVAFIGANAFSFNQLTSVNLLNSGYIGQDAFSANKLTSLFLPDGLTEIERQAFRNNNLTEITIPNSITKIGSFVFVGNGPSKDSLDITTWTSGDGGTWDLVGTVWVKRVSGGNGNEGPVSFNCGDDINITVGGINYTYTTKLVEGTGGYSKCWTSQNMYHGTELNYASTYPSNNSILEKWCNLSESCETHGAMYSWTEAMGFDITCTNNRCTDNNSENFSNSVCGALGSGWKLPSVNDFESLISSGATGWSGNKLYGIVNNLPGFRTTSNSFQFKNENVSYWTSNEYYSDSAYRFSLMHYKTGIDKYDDTKNYGFSVICIKNDEPR